MKKFIDAQHQNLVLWAGLLMTFGAAIYFSLTYEPYIPYPTIMATGLFGMLFIKRIPAGIRGVIALLFGFVYACAFTNWIDTPQIKSVLRDTNMTGHVYKIDSGNGKSRLYIKTDDDMRVRVSVGQDVTTPNVGDKISGTATMFRPAGKYAPETFDYARWAYFNKLSATGYITDYQVIDKSNSVQVNKLRDEIHTARNSFLIDTLVLGYKNAVPEDDNKIWTATGIGHVWSISGFHMTLVGGWLFAIFFLIFRSIPYITRRIPARIPAMGAAWIGLLGYLFISGVDVATVRAFLMTTLVFVAFAFGRRAISLRNVCLAFCAIFLINPHYVMQPGFQLSFSAVFGLVWFWGDSEYKSRTTKEKLMRVLYISVMTSIIATLFTAPFVIANFYSIPIYGIIGNLVLLPIFSFLIMPLVMIGTLGIDFATSFAHSIYDGTLVVAKHIADLPYATIDMPHIPNVAIVFFVLAMAACIFIRPVRIKVNYILCAIFTTCGIICVITQPAPIFMATHDHELVAFRNDDGDLVFNKKSASNHYFAFDTFLQLNGDTSDTPHKKIKCTKGVCEFKSKQLHIMYTQKFVPLMNNIHNWCDDNSIDYIVSYLDIDAPKCNHKILRDGFIIYDNGLIKYVPLNRRWHNLRE